MAVARGLALSPLGIQVFIFSNCIPIQATNMSDSVQTDCCVIVNTPFKWSCGFNSCQSDTVLIFSLSIMSGMLNRRA